MVNLRESVKEVLQNVKRDKSTTSFNQLEYNKAFDVSLKKISILVNDCSLQY